MSGRDLKGMDAWAVAMDFATDIYRSTTNFPRQETFGLKLQLRRAAVSIVSNIAEGHGRISNADYARFVLMARGSLKEAETQVMHPTPRIPHPASRIPISPSPISTARPAGT